MWSFEIPEVGEKIRQIEKSCDEAMKLNSPAPPITGLPARDILILEAKLHPPKKGFAQAEGLARMLHDLASIELQAMELGLRGLVEFPEAPMSFREGLRAVTLSEAEHLRLCLQGIEDLGFHWGDWPVHCALWAAVSSEDSLLDRILIVHRYLEGSGLDAGDGLLRRLDGANFTAPRKIVQQINDEEVGHVDFGSRWYREICRQDKRDPARDFPERMGALRERLPKRVEKINRDLRRRAGFTESELDYYEKLREEFLIPYRIRLERQKAVAESASAEKS